MCAAVTPRRTGRGQKRAIEQGAEQDENIKKPALTSRVGTAASQQASERDKAALEARAALQGPPCAQPSGGKHRVPMGRVADIVKLDVDDYHFNKVKISSRKLDQQQVEDIAEVDTESLVVNPSQEVTVCLYFDTGATKRFRISPTVFERRPEGKVFVRLSKTVSLCFTDCGEIVDRAKAVTDFAGHPWLALKGHLEIGHVFLTEKHGPSEIEVRRAAFKTRDK
tara:strand:+ start:189 stop:860 length:672 start_codon:yes stop_codon:yes gene_type:complete